MDSRRRGLGLIDRVFDYRRVPARMRDLIFRLLMRKTCKSRSRHVSLLGRRLGNEVSSNGTLSEGRYSFGTPGVLDSADLHVTSLFRRE